MAYKIIVSPRAQSEIEKAIDYYASRLFKKLSKYFHVFTTKETPVRDQEYKSHI